MQTRNEKFVFGLLPVIGLLSIWEGVARFGLLPASVLLPPFSDVLLELYSLSINGVLGTHFLSSLVRVLVGFILGAAAGIIFGITMGWNKVADKALNPIFSLLYPIPTLGWIPLLMLWVGINEMLPITLIFICSFFPILYNTITGVKGVNKDFINVAKCLGASDSKVLFSIVIPLALPNIFTGLRLEAGMAWRVIIAAEMVAIPSGIGALLMKAESLIRIDIILVCLIILAVMCLLFEKFFQYLEIRMTYKWRQYAIHHP